MTTAIRPPWDTYFMRMAFLAADRSTCLRRHVGAIAVRDRRILATGYNDVPSGIQHCHEKGGCLREKMGAESGQFLDLCPTVHAEQNLVIQCAVHGVSMKDAIVYCTHQPCMTCSKILINTKIAGLYYCEPYPSPMAEGMFAEAKIFLTKLILEDWPWPNVPGKPVPSDPITESGSQNNSR